jgi:phage tail sheath protein FI
MTFQTSPGIAVREIDLTGVVPAVSTSTAAVGGVFAWGPVNTPILVSTETDLIRRFGKPITDFNVETFYTASNFLSYSNAIFVSRANTGVTAAPVGGSAAAQAGFVARYPGAYGNSLRILAATASTFATANTILQNSVDFAPAAGEVHVVVVDATGVFTGANNTVLEVFSNLSLTAGAVTPNGTNNFWGDVIQDRSNYITMTTANSSPLSVAVDATLQAGTNGATENAITVGLLQASYEPFRNPLEFDISFLLQGVARGANGTEMANWLIAMAEERGDCMVFISPERADVLSGNNTNVSARADIIGFANNVTSSSYAVIDTGYKYRYDRYNDRYIFVPLNGDIAGLCAATDESRDPWFSPAGYNRGFIKNVIRLAYNPGKTDRDELYKNSVNPVITETGQGTLLFGDKTALKRPSAFDRINVRRLMIVLRKAISRAARSTLFEFNDEFTRAQFKNTVEPFLRDIQGRRGLTDFRVQCDSTNNTPEVIDTNRFIADIYIKPSRTISYITLNFIATRTGAEFTEITGTSR